MFSWMSSAVPSTPSGPGSMVARVSTMKFGPSSAVLGMPSVPASNSGSSGCSGMKTVPLPPLFTRSSP